ncbi:MAG: pyridoxal-dependent decarboxylase [Pseudomonadota bacterium]
MAAQGGEGPADLVRLAADLLEGGEGAGAPLVGLAEDLPEEGMGAGRALARLAPEILGRAADLGAPLAFAHMDPPTLPVAQAVTWWNAVLNQNLLHPDTSPAARAAEARAVAWLAPYFGMDGGHMLPGSTLANLTALWAARDLRGVRRVVASGSAHLSVAKAAHILGLEFEAVATDAADRLDVAAAGRLTDACLVLTAGTTSSGAIDPLGIAVRRRTHAAWVHVDAAWAGPLRLSRRHGAALDGIEDADSVAVSAHKLALPAQGERARALSRDGGGAWGAELRRRLSRRAEYRRAGFTWGGRGRAASEPDGPWSGGDRGTDRPGDGAGRDACGSAHRHRRGDSLCHASHWGGALAA